MFELRERTAEVLCRQQARVLGTPESGKSRRENRRPIQRRNNAHTIPHGAVERGKQ